MTIHPLQSPHDREAMQRKTAIPPLCRVTCGGVVYLASP